MRASLAICIACGLFAVFAYARQDESDVEAVKTPPGRFADILQPGQRVLIQYPNLDSGDPRLVIYISERDSGNGFAGRVVRTGADYVLVKGARRSEFRYLNVASIDEIRDLTMKE